MSDDHEKALTSTSNREPDVRRTAYRARPLRGSASGHPRRARDDGTKDCDLRVLQRRVKELGLADGEVADRADRILRLVLSASVVRLGAP